MLREETELTTAAENEPGREAPTGMLAFFPWLRLREHPTVGLYELLPYTRGEEPAGKGSPLQATLDTLLEPYVASQNEPTDHATLLCCNSRDVTVELTEEERAAMFELSELVAFVGLAAREYFRHSYWNRDHFHFVIQSFRDARGGAWIMTRRRDGSTWNYLPHDHYLVARPFHVGNATVSLDQAFLESLHGLRNAADWTRYREAIETFNLANTDSMDLREEVEIVLINGAFERLFNLNRGREAELAEAFCAAVVPFSEVAFDDCDRVAARPDRADRIDRRDSVRDLWIRDFFRLRNEFAHGRREAAYPALWTLREHLLLASFIFPLAFKAVLEAEGRYALTEGDRRHIDAFEALACAEHFTEESASSAAFDWERIIRRAGLKHRISAYFGRPEGS